MLPHYPDLIRCPHCGGLFRASQATRAKKQPKGYVSSFPSPPDLTEENWLDALDQNLYGGDDERNGRVLAWHSANDKRRGTEKPDFEFSSRALQNLERLLLLMNDDTNDQLLTGEIYRELNRFDDCIAMLDSIKEEDLQPFCQQIRRRAEQRNAALFAFKLD